MGIAIGVGLPLEISSGANDWDVNPSDYLQDESGDLILDEDGNPIPKG